MNQNNSDVIIYKIAAFAIFIVLVILVVGISIATARNANDPLVTDDTVENGFSQSITTEAPDSTTELITTESQNTTEAPPAKITTEAPPTTTPAPVTPPSPPVTAPSTNVSDEWAALLKKYPNTVLKETKDAGENYLNKLVFLGDSTTYGLKRYNMLSGGFYTNQVWTPKSGTLTLSTVSFSTIVYPETGKEITIKEAIIAKKPEYLVITLGLNGVSFMDESSFKSEYTSMIKMIQKESPDTKIICQSIFPVARSYELLKSINNEKIRRANEWILEIAHETGTKYLDTYSVMCDNEGWLPEKYQNGDGLHPTPECYSLELANLRTHAYID